MATPTLKYVAPTTPEDDLTFAPEPVVIYGVPSGGGGGGDVASVNGQTGTVVLTASDVGAAPTNHTQAISTITGLEDALDDKANVVDVVDLANNMQTSLTAVSDVANAAVTGLNGVTGLWKGTQAAYNALTPDANVVYIIQG